MLRSRIQLASRILSNSSECGRVTTLTLDNPVGKQSLSVDILKSLREIVKSPPLNTRVIVFTSSDPRIFCSGHDINDFYQHEVSKPSHSALFASCQSTMLAIRNCPVPTIASVSGAATGAGLQLVLSCDLALCAPSSRFSTPGVSLGLFCSTPSVPLLSSAIPRKLAMEMLLTGEFVSGERAAEVGLVNYCSQNLEEDTLNMAMKVAEGSPEAMRVGKAGILRREGMGNEVERYNDASGTMVENLEGEDAREGMTAFLEKRPPKWPSNK